MFQKIPPQNDPYQIAARASIVGKTNKPFDKSPFGSLIYRKHKTQKPFKVKKVHLKERKSQPFDNSPFLAIRKNKVGSIPINFNPFSLGRVEVQTEIISNHMTKDNWEKAAFLPTILSKLQKQSEYKKMLGLQYNEKHLPNDVTLTDAEKIYLNTVDVNIIKDSINDLPSDIAREVQTILKDLLSDIKSTEKPPKKSIDDVVENLFKDKEFLPIYSKDFFITIAFEILSMSINPERLELELNDNKELSDKLVDYIDKTNLVKNGKIDKDEFIDFLNNYEEMRSLKDVYKDVLNPSPEEEKKTMIPLKDMDQEDIINNYSSEFLKGVFVSVLSKKGKKISNFGFRMADKSNHGIKQTISKQYYDKLKFDPFMKELLKGYIGEIDFNEKQKKNEVADNLLKVLSYDSAKDISRFIKDHKPNVDDVDIKVVRI